MSEVDVSPLRTLEDLLDAQLWPCQGICPDPEESRRHTAIYYVLRTIPAAHFAELKKAAESFTWHVPHYDAYGSVYPFGTTVKTGGYSYAKLVYLSPRLETTCWDFIIAVVAHELAHLCLNHKVLGHGGEYTGQEEQAWELVRNWGFARQEKKHLAITRRRETREAHLLERFKAENQA